VVGPAGLWRVAHALSPADPGTGRGGMDAMHDLIACLPKVELHIHIEGSLEPDLMFELAGRNGIDLPYASVDEVRRAYEFSDLQSFLDIYYQGAQVLLTERDFYDILDSFNGERSSFFCKIYKLPHNEIRDELNVFFQFSI